MANCESWQLEGGHGGSGNVGGRAGGGSEGSGGGDGGHGNSGGLAAMSQSLGGCVARPEKPGRRLRHSSRERARDGAPSTMQHLMQPSKGLWLTTTKINWKFSLVLLPLPLLTVLRPAGRAGTLPWAANFRSTPRPQQDRASTALRGAMQTLSAHQVWVALAVAAAHGLHNL